MRSSHTHSKASYKQNGKITYRLRQNICKGCNRQWLNFQNKSTAQAAQFQKNKRPNQKISQRTKQTFLQRRHTDG